MKKIKVMTIFGTRPEAIKMAPLVKELEKSEHIESIVCVTAQHRQMLDQVLEIFDIHPDYDLDVMKDRQTLVGTTARVLEGLDGVFEKEHPDLVLVHGDTLTTFVGALAAFYKQIKIGHVEAGLRTFNKYSPFPEEMNRKLTGAMADLHLAPTENSKNNLLREAVSEDVIYITGNTAIDALKTTVKEDYIFQNEVLRNVDFENKRVITVTAHRRENLGEPLENILQAIKYIVEKYKDTEVVYPVHLNPVVREAANRVLGNVERVNLIDPIDVNETHNLLKRCYLVMTDSGGIQEEAPSLGKPVLVLRTETERPEAVKAGTVKVAGVNKDEIIKLAEELLNNSEEYNKMSRAVNPYGDGQASRRIVEAILYEFGIRKEKPEEWKV